MKIVRSTRELQAIADAERAAGRRIALVPTMGALHAGHVSLVAAARERADLVCLSIFVNPTQFNDPKDYEAYPVTFEADCAACREAGVDVVFAPPASELYPEGAQTWVEVSELAKPLCGAARPGHFRGVTTVVAKLFLAAKPHVAVFGEKDFQQLAVIRRMARDLGFDVEVVGAPIVREADGLAMSSRNVHLGPRARREATAIRRALAAAERAVALGELGRERLLEIARTEIAQAVGAELDYAELRSPDTLALAPERLDGPALLALAVFFAPEAKGAPCVRLIDNCVLAPPVAAARAMARS